MAVLAKILWGVAGPRAPSGGNNNQSVEKLGGGQKVKGRGPPGPGLETPLPGCNRVCHFNPKITSLVSDTIETYPSVTAVSSRLRHNTQRLLKYIVMSA